MAHISDYKEAIVFFTNHSDIDFDINFIESISPHAYEPTMIFKMSDGSTYHVSKECGFIIHTYPDTWRNPEHREVIYDADEEVKKIIADFREWSKNRTSEIHTWHPSPFA